ncbi:hypothetical protein [Methylobacterium soli]|nr:hypothetical protein [Methylobacterium soli]GJE42613.1 hypothetical protein AEGHOMDF_1785 [Methylobacterium soli]
MRALNPMAALLASVPVLVPILASPAARAGERPAPARLCPEDAPEGVRLPSRPGCGRSVPGAAAADGFRDLGNGVKLRIGGRVSADYGVRR